MKRLVLTAVLMMACLNAGDASPAVAATVNSNCSLPASVKATSQLADLPSRILRQMPGLGPADGPIRTDALLPDDTRPTTRLEQAFNRGSLWAIVYQTGGFANARMVAVFVISADQKEAESIGRHVGPQEGGVCAILRAAFKKSSD
jgi:hypothetical protein